MKTSTLIAAGAIAIAFDLGVLVVSSQAADDHVPFKNTKAEAVSLNFQKIDLTHTEKMCATNGGKLGAQNGVQGCLLPGKGGPASISDQAAGGTLTSYKK
jgi:hypothetical protein